MSQETTKEWNVGDAVRVYASSYEKEQFYLYGRIVYIDTFSDESDRENKYGILYYNRDKELCVMHATESQVVESPVWKPTSCPSHGTTMEYADNLAEQDRLECVVELTEIQI